MKSETDPIGECRLTESTDYAANANPLSDMDVDWMGAEFLNGASFSSSHNTSVYSSRCFRYRLQLIAFPDKKAMDKFDMNTIDLQILSHDAPDYLHSAAALAIWRATSRE